MKKVKSLANREITKSKQILNKVSEPVDIENLQAYSSIIKTLRDYMELNDKVQGISAIQFGSPNRICLMRLKGKLYTILNPVILFSFGKKMSLEHCESCKDYWKLSRPLLCKVEYFNEEGAICRKLLLRRGTRIIHHEVDHMNGLLISDKGKRWVGSSWVKVH